MASNNFSGIRADGLKQLQKDLENKFSRQRMNKIIDKALIKAGNIVLDAIKSNIRYFRDTGAEYEEAKLSRLIETKAFVQYVYIGKDHITDILLSI